MNALMSRIEAGWTQLGELVNRVEDAAGLNTVGGDGWTVKDHLAHVAAWEHSLLALLEGRDRSGAMGLTEPMEEIDSINEEIRKLHANDTADEALGYFRDSHAKLMAAVGKLDDVDLQKPYSDYQPSDPDEKRPVEAWVSGNTYEHYAEHVNWINQLLRNSSASR